MRLTPKKCQVQVRQPGATPNFRRLFVLPRLPDSRPGRVSSQSAHASGRAESDSDVIIAFYLASKINKLRAQVQKRWGGERRRIDFLLL